MFLRKTKPVKIFLFLIFYSLTCRISIINCSRLDVYICIYYLEMMFELESFFTFGTFELAKHRALVVTYHVSLEPVHVGERLVAYLARLFVV